MRTLELPEKNARRLSDVAYAEIRRAIVRCAVLPGSALTENDFVVQFGHTRASVRAALSRLEAEGLIKPERRIGYVVKPITIREAIELTDVGKILLSASARMAVGRVDVGLLKELDSKCRQKFDPANPSSVESFLEADCNFHSAIARATGNLRLAALSHGALMEARRLFQFAWNGRARAQKLADDHAELIEALAGADPDRAAAVTERHSESAKKFVLDALLSSPAVLDTSVGSAAAANVVSITARSPSTADLGAAAAPESRRRGRAKPGAEEK